MNSTEAAQVLLIAIVGGTVPCAVLYSIAKSLLRRVLINVHKESKIRCPLCKRVGAASDVDSEQGGAQRLRGSPDAEGGVSDSCANTEETLP